MEDLTLSYKKLEEKIFGYSAVMIVFIFFLNYVGMRMHLYTAFWYFDMIMHFLGGVFLGLVSISLIMRSKILPREDAGSLILVSLIAVLIVAMGWELFEAGIDVFFDTKQHFLMDTVSDMFFGLAGAALASIYYLRKHFNLFK